MLKKQERKGIYFGLITSIMTIIPFLIGLYSSSSVSRKHIILGLLSMCISDALADGYGVYLSNSTMTNKKVPYHIAIYTIITKIIILVLFLLPFILQTNITNGIIISLIIGFILLIYLSKILSKDIKLSYLSTFLRIGCITIITIFICVTLTVNLERIE